MLRRGRSHRETGEQKGRFSPVPDASVLEDRLGSGAVGGRSRRPSVSHIKPSPLTNRRQMLRPVANHGHDAGRSVKCVSWPQGLRASCPMRNCPHEIGRREIGRMITAKPDGFFFSALPHYSLQRVAKAAATKWDSEKGERVALFLMCGCRNDARSGALPLRPCDLTFLLACLQAVAGRNGRGAGHAGEMCFPAAGGVIHPAPGIGQHIAFLQRSLNQNPVSCGLCREPTQQHTVLPLAASGDARHDLRCGGFLGRGQRGQNHGFGPSRGGGRGRKAQPFGTAGIHRCGGKQATGRCHASGGQLGAKLAVIRLHIRGLAVARCLNRAG